MILPDLIGAPQIAAVLVLMQRGLEELHSARNTKRLKAEGAYEVERPYYRVVAVTHLAWIASIFLLIPPYAIVLWPLLVYYIVLQVVRYWIILSLGRYWTHGIICVPNAPIVRSGPYRYLHHPNYALTIVETFVLPLAFGALALAIIMTALWWTVLSYKIRLEDDSFAERSANQRSITRK